MAGVSSSSSLSASLYDAQDISEGLRVLQTIFPKWALPCAVVGGIATYAAIFQGRLTLAKWRKKEKDIERSSSMAASVFSAEEDFNDASLLTFDEVEEFRRSLGIVLPRDADLLAQIEMMLIDDPIPEGWELYRCSFGVRFRNTTTGALSFFHPAAHALELNIRQELASRDAESNGTEFSALATSGQTMFDQPMADDDNSHQTTFMNVFDAFLKREHENPVDSASTQSVSTPRRGASVSNRAMGSMRTSTILPSRR